MPRSVRCIETPPGPEAQVGAGFRYSAKNAPLNRRADLGSFDYLIHHPRSGGLAKRLGKSTFNLDRKCHDLVTSIQTCCYEWTGNCCEIVTNR